MIRSVRVVRVRMIRSVCVSVYDSSMRGCVCDAYTLIIRIH